ncbi:MBL fold hydrolase [Clostridium botulinum]|uniref:MBL fold hydrolase n=1 Tax=Clostridium botulinum TaxID=1491 RepID=A0ABC8CYY7_CLOBO|nr:MBL fold metallo-hydrolase [Clostridium botulinum]AVQ40278.1 MBL fold hydrolase [Clostridium botulinum]
MEIKFLGAACCVTGSCHLLKIKDKNILLDCGTYQGKDEIGDRNYSFKFDVKDIDCVILSHAHIDHSGRIPLLYKLGYRGKVISTKATADLCSIMLPDSGHILESEVEWKNRKRIRSGLDPIEPLYTLKIAQMSTSLFEGYNYNEYIEIFPNLKIRFLDSGHLLGSAITELYITENDKEFKIVYSGDLGNTNLPILKDPVQVDYADYLLMETTYGNRVHDNINSQLKQLIHIIKDTFKRGGNVIIPSFAVGRTQEVIYALNKYVESNILKNIKVYVDSPLASEATKIFNEYTIDFDEDAQKLLNKGDNPLEFNGLYFTNSPQESMELNKIKTGAIIISASGMCEAGRIRHHLKHNLWRKECSIVFVGYQAEGTLGQKILSGAKKVKLFGEEIAVNAEIYNLPSLSGHADKNGLLNWLESFREKPKEVILIHGEKDSRDYFRNLLIEKNYNTFCPNIGDIYSSEFKGQRKSEIKNKITNLLSSIEDIDSLNKEDLLNLIKKEIY